MKSKVWIKTEITTENDQDIRIQPTPEFDGIVIEFKESADDYHNGRLYLNTESMEALIAKMRETMDYVKQ
jgi:pyruvate kinase